MRLHTLNTLGTALFSLLILGACAQVSPFVIKSDDIRAGMSSGEVVALMGEPQNLQSDGGKDVWQYCATGFETDQYIAVTVKDDIVTGMERYENSHNTGSCDNFFRAVD